MRDWLYYAGGTWRRLNLRTGAEEMLAADPPQVPGHGCGDRWELQRSGHYGLVAFSAGKLYRVRVADAAPQSPDDRGRADGPRGCPLALAGGPRTGHAGPGLRSTSRT